jgi:uncharacterized protein YbjT (DUF2867 family)
MPEYSKNNIHNNSDLFCEGLPTSPLSDAGKILVTGASGYIGGRLVPELLARGYDVRAMVRGNPEVYKDLWPNSEVASADALNVDQLNIALEDIDTAYYLIHSLQLGIKEFEIADISAARNFRKVAENKRVKRIIYLGGLGDKRSSLSSHLRNRIEVSDELTKGNVPVTILRAAIIIGSGSASYEIIQHLVKRLPVIITPRWTKNRCQPIAVRDVVKYLVGVLEVPETLGRYFDIGGKDVLTYGEMLRILANILNKKTIFISSPFLIPTLYAYMASLITPVPNAITQCLMEGLKNDVVCQNDSINKYISFEHLSYNEAIIRAMTREEQDKVYTRWSDAYPPAHELALKLHELNHETTYSTQYSILSEKTSSSLFQSICKIGGKEGWFRNNWMWRLRGTLDRILTGVGTLRGRKSYYHLNVNDVIDFWRIENIEKNKMLLLRAEMKIPGRAWLKFNIDTEMDKRRLSVTAYYDTQTLSGKIYWYNFLPFHHFIFKHLIEEIEKRGN